jgi:hypothetical protein
MYRDCIPTKSHCRTIGKKGLCSPGTVHIVVAGLEMRRKAHDSVVLVRGSVVVEWLGGWVVGYSHEKE